MAVMSLQTYGTANSHATKFAHALTSPALSAVNTVEDRGRGYRCDDETASRLH